MQGKQQPPCLSYGPGDTGEAATFLSIIGVSRGVKICRKIRVVRDLVGWQGEAASMVVGGGAVGGRAMRRGYCVDASGSGRQRLAVGPTVCGALSGMNRTAGG